MAKAKAQKGKVVLVCGGREYANENAVCKLLKRMRPSKVINGGARGADWLSTKVARNLGIPVQVFRADWLNYGKSAGFIRNGRMLETAKPDFVLAFPGGAGTADMVRRAKKANVTVIFAEEFLNAQGSCSPPTGKRGAGS